MGTGVACNLTTQDDGLDFCQTHRSHSSADDLKCKSEKTNLFVVFCFILYSYSNNYLEHWFFIYWLNSDLFKEQIIQLSINIVFLSVILARIVCKTAKLAHLCQLFVWSSPPTDWYNVCKTPCISSKHTLRQSTHNKHHSGANQCLTYLQFKAVVLAQPKWYGHCV